MEKLYRARIQRRGFNERQQGAQNPIELDNKSYDLIDGDKKSLDYLDYYGTLTKGALAAEGIIKICPCSKGDNIDHYGASVPTIKQAQNQEEPEEEFKNEWDNIFLTKINT